MRQQIGGLQVCFVMALCFLRAKARHRSSGSRAVPSALVHHIEHSLVFQQRRQVQPLELTLIELAVQSSQRTMKSTMLYTATVVLASRSASALVPNPIGAFLNSSTTRLHNFFGSSSAKTESKYPIMADESVMSKKAHGTSEKPVMKSLRWNCDYDTADRICNFNRHYAEFAGYWTTTTFLQYVKENPKEIDFFDSVTGKLLFTAPKGRTMQEFLQESQSHGWPSFRDEEVNWDYVRVLKDGECVSTTGTHLGHNLPDRSGNRYCINLVSVAGINVEEKSEEK